MYVHTGVAADSLHTEDMFKYPYRKQFWRRKFIYIHIYIYIHTGVAAGSLHTEDML